MAKTETFDSRPQSVFDDAATLIGSSIHIPAEKGSPSSIAPLHPPRWALYSVAAACFIIVSCFAIEHDHLHWEFTLTLVSLVGSLETAFMACLFFLITREQKKQSKDLESFGTPAGEFSSKKVGATVDFPETAGRKSSHSSSKVSHWVTITVACFLEFVWVFMIAIIGMELQDWRSGLPGPQGLGDSQNIVLALAASLLAVIIFGLQFFIIVRLVAERRLVKKGTSS